MIVKSVIENIDAIGGPRGIPGIPRLTTLPWVFFWTVALVWAIRNFVYSNYGRGVLAEREDEIASELMSVHTRRVKFLAFALASFCAGVAGALFAHLLQFISPRVFDVIKTTDILIMVYLGGIASLGGSILGATLYTVLLEILRPSSVAALLSRRAPHGRGRRHRRRRRPPRRDPVRPEDGAGLRRGRRVAGGVNLEDVFAEAGKKGDAPQLEKLGISGARFLVLEAKGAGAYLVKYEPPAGEAR